MSDAPLTVLSILRSGARVTFDDFSYIQGMPLDGYIRVRTKLSFGDKYSLCEDGLKQALRSLEEMRDTPAT